MKTQLFLMLISIFTFFSCKKENSEIPLPGHPQPNFERPVWQNLNGYWQFKADSTNVGLSENWQNKPETFNQKILVPFSWASPMSEIELPKVNVGWYSRTFTIENTKNREGKNTWLVFCASDFNTTVWMNGNEVGTHSGGYVPFSFNIEEFLTEGENRLVVRVEDEELQNRPSGKQYYGNAKGIWQTVFIEARPENYIKNIRFTPDIDNQLVTAEVNLAENAASEFQFSLKGKNNSLSFTGEISAGSNTATFNIPVTKMKLWNLEKPFLYEVIAALTGENNTDEVSTYFGMRKISAVEIPGKGFQYVALNNEPIYLKLALDQSYHPEGFYTFPSDQFMMEEIQRAKDLGLNGLRIHIKAEIPENCTGLINLDC
jgi:beta-galactosidase/beta-glucuronidase